MKEELLEPLLRRLRIRSVLPYFSRYPGCRLLDVGCGREAHLLRSAEPHIAFGTGIDANAPERQTPRWHTRSITLERHLPFDDGSFDLVTMLAVLEHLDHPESLVRECARLLRPGGGLLLTVPSRRARPLLEFLAFRLGVVSPREIAEHKRYFDREDLFALFEGIPNLRVVEHRYFQLGCNNRLFAVKLPQD